MIFWSGQQTAEEKPFNNELCSSDCIRDDGYSSPVDFRTTVKEPKTLLGIWEVSLQEFDMPNYMETFQTFDLESNRSLGVFYVNVDLMLDQTEGPPVCLWFRFYLPHRHWCVRDLLKYVNETMCEWSRHICPHVGGKNIVGEYVVDYMCTAQVDEQSGFVEISTHPELSGNFIKEFSNLLNMYADLVPGHTVKALLMDVCFSDELCAYLGGPFVGLEKIKHTPRVGTKVVWEIDFAADKWPLAKCQKTILPGRFSSLIVKCNLVGNDNNKLGDLAHCLIPVDEGDSVGLSFGGP